MIALKSHHLRAALHCAAKKDVRTYLNAVAVGVDAQQRVRVMSADGHRGFIGWDEHPIWDTDANDEPMPQKGPFTIIIPRETVEMALKAVGKAGLVPFVALASGRYCLATVQFAAIDARYPDMDRVIPNPATAKPAETPNTVDPDLLSGALAAMVEFTQAKKTRKGLFPLRHFHNGTVVYSSQSAVAVVMALRVDDSDWQTPFMHRELADTTADTTADTIAA